MLPTLDKASAVSISRGAKAPRGKVSSHQTDDTASRSQWHISKLPDDALSHIFNYLGCDAIAQINDTCRQFRKLVHARHWEALLYSQLPVLWRKQVLQSLPWQKQMVQDDLHPFIDKLSFKERVVCNAEQQAAVSRFHPLGRMISTSRYRPMEVLAQGFSMNCGEVFYTATSSNILLYRKDASGMFLLGQNESGSWSIQSLSQVVQDIRPLAGVSFSSNRRYLSVFARKKMIQVYKFDSGSWQLNDQQQIEAEGRLEVSPSGKYLTVLTNTRNIESIRCFDETACWKSMPMPSGNWNDLSVQSRQFSHSEQHVVIRYEKKLVILSMNCRGHWNLSWETICKRGTDRVRLQFAPSEQHVAIRYKNKLVILTLDSGSSWNPSWKTPSNRRINYAEFCPSGSWLLIGFLDSVEMIGLDPAGKCISQQTISSQNLNLTFSPAGHYLCSHRFEEQYLLWRLLKSGQWTFCGDLTDPEAPPWPGLEQVKLQPFCTKFSLCDNYLLTSTRDGVVNIWGRDEQGSWMVLGSEQHDSIPFDARFSQSGVHALTVDRFSIRIWGRDNGGLWSVKGGIPAAGVNCAFFHPVAEHLIVFSWFDEIRILEIRGVLEPEVR